MKGKKKKKKTSVPLGVKGFRTTEKKEIYTSNTTLFPAVSVTTWNAPVLLNSVAQGTGDNQYIGRKLLMKSLQLRWQIGKTTSIVGGSPIRLLVFYDSQSNGGTPTMGGTNSAVLVNDAIASNMNLDEAKRFSVIIDKTIFLDATNQGSAYVKKFRKLNHEMYFTDVAAGIANIAKGAIWATVCQNGRIITTALQSTFESRIRFIDI